MQTTRTLPTQGRKSPRFGHLGVWNLCLGPQSVLPGPRLQVVIINEQGRIVRRFEQIQGDCIDPGYVDFFLSHNCRPAAHEHPLVDIDEHGQIVKVLHPNYTASMGMGPYLELLSDWVAAHGRPEYAL